MGKRNVAKITVDGTDYTLMQFSDFSYIPNRYDATRYQMELANGIYYPTGVSVQGNTMNDIIPQGIGSSADNVSKPIDNYNAILLKQVPANQGNANFFSFYNSSNELLFEEGYLMTNYEANTLVNFAIVIDDDGFADVIGVLHYYNGSVTATRIDHFGGNGEIGQKIYAVFAQEASQSYTSNGGGATHIAKVTGQLKDLSSNLSDILIVSGGGGGGLLVGDTDYSGKEAGGISGSGSNSGNQSSGYAFGQGESGTNVSGGGSGLYGGYKGTSSKSGGAGSGYIGNSLLSNKKMVGYNVPTSSAEATKTESVNEVSASAVSGKPKSGNGFARIKFLNPETIYAFHIDGSKSNPTEMITYLNDALGKSPAYMDFSSGKFVWGDWEDAFFIPKPCILGQNGIVQKYLNPNDYTKDIDGNAVTIDSSLNNANVMVEFPKIYYKIVPDSGSAISATVYISNKKHDNEYVDYAYIDSSKNHKDKFYLAAYMPTVINSVIRSVSGATAAGGQVIGTNISRAQSNGTGWYNLFYSQIILVNFLLMLIGKSTNVQAIFGKGICSGGGNESADFSRVPAGLNNSKGLFYGTNNGSISSGNNGVKIFGIENYYSYLPKQISGISYGKYKLCWGQEDGSTNDNYNTSATGYFSVGSSQSGWIKDMVFNGKGMFYGTTGGSASTYYCDYRWGSNGQVARFGGSTWDGDNDGIFYLADDSNSGRWHDCATLSYI